MNPPNIKIYLVLSGVIIVLFLFVLLVPFGKKTNNQQPTINNYVTPTIFELNPTASQQTPIISPAGFTGAIIATLPPEQANLATQKQDLRGKTPLVLSTFTIDFDYSEDKFVVTLNEPKDQSQKEFAGWRNNNYPAIPVEQFILK